MTRPTLFEHILQTQAQHPGATGKLSRILSRIGLAGRMIAQRILSASFLGDHGDAGLVNVQGEDVKKMDVLSNEIFIRVFDSLDSVNAIGSEEMEDLYHYPDPEGRGEYVVLFDPLDGSGNIDINGSIGSIFSVHRRVSEGPKAEHADFLQAGNTQVAGGYILYGPATVFVYTAGDNSTVNCFTLDRMIV